MKRFWRIIIVIVLIAIVLGVIGLLAGMLTGANMDRIYSVFDEKYSVHTYYQNARIYLQYAVDVVKAVGRAIF